MANPKFIFMQKVIQAKYAVLILMITAIASYNSAINTLLTSLLISIFRPGLEEDLQKLLLLAGKLISISVIFTAFSFVYDNLLWKIIFPEYNINGWWKYRNSYLGEAGVTTGKVKIKQTPYSVKLVDGKSTKTNPYTAQFWSFSCSFDEHTGKLNAAYMVKRFHPDEPSKFAEKKSVIVLDINRREKWSFFRKKPSSMTGHFYNCIMSADEEQKLSSHQLGSWPVRQGTAIYEKI
jgi:hypothetical protein